MHPVLPSLDRRAFLRTVAVGGLASGASLALDSATGAGSPDTQYPPLTVFAGTPTERGQAYGRRFKEQIRSFLDKEIFVAFTEKPATKAEMVRYAGQCARTIRSTLPEVHAELAGVAAGADLSEEELVLLHLHEELHYKGILPNVQHCTAVAVGPPETKDGHTFVGQTWDWMQSAFGLSRVVLWKREQGPSVLAYGFPGLWVGAGLNSAGLAFCWTSAGGLTKANPGPRVGIPSYTLLTHLLYQDSLEAVAREAKRLPQAGWFTFVFADGKGNLLNIEGSPQQLVVEPAKGRLTRVGYGSRAMTGTAVDQPVPQHKRCRKVCELFDAATGQVDRALLQAAFAEPKHEISVGKSTIDLMVFDTTAREAYVSRGPSYQVDWKRLTFE